MMGTFSILRTIQSKEVFVDCPKFNSAKEAVQFFLETDQLGVRLNSDSVKNLNNCVGFDDLQAWDTFQIVQHYELNKCSGAQKRSIYCFELSYVPLGNLTVTRPIELNKTQTKVKLEVLVEKKGERWSLSGINKLMPMLSKGEAISVLEGWKIQSDFKGSAKDWIAKALIDLEKM